MEDHEYLKNLIRPGDFMTPIDLLNALFSILLHKDNKNFCLFDSKDNKYNFNFLSFGLTLYPRIFIKIMNPIILHLRSKNIKVSTYLNDNFTRAQSEGTLKKLCLYCNKSSQ